MPSIRVHPRPIRVIRVPLPVSLPPARYPPARLPASRPPGPRMLTTAPTLDHLYSLFPDSPDRPDAVEVPAADVPQPYHRLLVHTHHMTVTVEEFYRSPVDVRVLDCRRTGNEYARKILLTHAARPAASCSSGSCASTWASAPRRCGTRSSRGRRRSAAC